MQVNLELFGIEPSPVWSIKILDTSSAATLFVTILGALLVRHQFALGVLPRINYKTARTERHSRKNAGNVFETWRVEIRNTGLGSAIVNRAEYFLGGVSLKGNPHPYRFEEIIHELEKIDLVRDRDYWIENITSGFSLSPKDECFVFEIKTEHFEKLKSLDMVLYFQGQLGDRYCREIFLIPHVL